MKAIVYAAFFGLAVLASASCNREDAPTPATCRITSGQDRYTSVRDEHASYSFSYDGDRRVTAYEETGSAPKKKIFSYHTGLIVGLQMENGELMRRDSIYLNGAGYVTRFVVVSLPDQGIITSTNYTYNADNKLTAFTRERPGGPINVALEYNSAGDMVKQTWPNNYTAEYEYYPDKAVRIGDFYQYQDLIAFGSGWQYGSAHLIKRINHSVGIVTDFVYEFDGDDRITKTTITEAGITREVTLQQNCY